MMARRTEDRIVPAHDRDESGARSGKPLNEGAHS
jgi:hypothetical protein